MEIYDIVAQLGFPIAVAAWALYNSHKHEEFLQGTLTSTLKENTEATKKLAELVKKFLTLYTKNEGGEEDDI